ncbi:MAG: AI-2E family transporter [Anaerolineaceae bacterium]|nr:AI-2E family transporter [Anaerolineaceae bacterium]MBN2676610.1 AI-2E family transporter [Anaerolineaceae bacterium]
MAKKNTRSYSPRWNWTTRLVVGITLVAIIAFLAIHFQNLIAPLLLALILAYLFYPMARFLTRSLKIPWRLSVTLIYLLFILVILGLLTWGGFVLVDQLQSLYAFLQRTFINLPKILSDFAKTGLSIGFIHIDLSGMDYSSLSQEILSIVEPYMGRIGNFVGVVAGGAASSIGWLFFIILISYFMLVETGGIHGRLLHFEIPNYEQDMRRLGRELSRIWNAFLRGQAIIVIITVLLYMVILAVMGLRFPIWLALLAGFAKFLPWVGPFIAWTTYGLVAYFQVPTPYGLDPFTYAIIVVVVALLVDNVFDYLVSPRIFAQTLKIHPAGVLITALIAIDLLGVVGVILAAPVLATLKLISQYVMNKMFDRDPWANYDQQLPPPRSPQLITGLLSAWKTLRSGLAARPAKKPVEVDDETG